MEKVPVGEMLRDLKSTIAAIPQKAQTKIRESQTKPNVALVLVVLISVISIVVIMAYGQYRCNHPDFVDPIQYSVFGDDPLVRSFLDGWGLSHFAFHFVVAALFPHKQVMAFLVAAGIAWELVECLNHEYPFYMTECPAMLETDHETGKPKHKWWYGRWQDVVMNTAGMAAGYGFRKQVIDKFSKNHQPQSQRNKFTRTL